MHGDLSRGESLVLGMGMGPGPSMGRKGGGVIVVVLVVAVVRCQSGVRKKLLWANVMMEVEFWFRCCNDWSFEDGSRWMTKRKEGKTMELCALYTMVRDTLSGVVCHR